MSSSATEELSTADQLHLGLSRTYYAVARALRVNKLRDLLHSASITLDAVVWLLGRCYSAQQQPGAGEAEQEEVSGCTRCWRRLCEMREPQQMLPPITCCAASPACARRRLVPRRR